MFIGELGDDDATKHLNHRQRTLYNEFKEENERQIKQKANELQRLKNNLRVCIKKGVVTKGSFARKVPDEIDILNDYR